MEDGKKLSGISLAGTILVDVVKTIDYFPPIGALANISKVSQAVGGSVPNTGIDLAKIDASLPIKCYGCIGNDAYGDFIVKRLNDHGIDSSGIIYTDELPTSFSDVMSIPTGERTFFHARGANSRFSPADIPIKELNCELLHVGYALLLDQFDAPDDEYGTVMARFLHDVQTLGIKTSVDMVSDNSCDYAAMILPILPFCDYLIINEYECCSIWGLSPSDKNGKSDYAAIRKAMELSISAGVREKVIIHCKEAGFLLDKTGSFTALPSLDIPGELIKGSVGAGDAFCAGALYSIYHGYDDAHLLSFASSAAACSLFEENSVDGMRDCVHIEDMKNRFKRKNIILSKE